MKRVLTYGTFDLLHWGHIRLLKRARAQGDYLVAAASTDDFVVDHKGGRRPYHSFATRCSMLEAVRYVDLVIPEATWEQKKNDIVRYRIDTVVMGSNWQGSAHFHDLRDLCEVIFLPRTDGISTRQIRRDLLADAVRTPGGPLAPATGHTGPAVDAPNLSHAPADPRAPHTGAPHAPSLPDASSPSTARLSALPVGSRAR